MKKNRKRVYYKLPYGSRVMDSGAHVEAPVYWRFYYVYPGAKVLHFTWFLTDRPKLVRLGVKDRK